MKKYSENSDLSTKCEIEFCRHKRVFLLPSENAWRIKPHNSAKYWNNDGGELEARPKQNTDIRKCWESGI